MRHVGENVARLRSFRRIPQKDVAAQLGLTQSEYSRIEKKAEIEDDLLQRIAAAIDFPVELIRELDNSIQTIHNNGSITDSIFYQHNPTEQIVALYERMLKEKDELLRQKDELIDLYKKQLKLS